VNGPEHEARGRHRTNESLAHQFSFEDLEGRAAVSEAERIVKGEPLTEAELLFQEFAREYLTQHGPTDENELWAMWCVYYQGYIQALLDDGQKRGEYTCRRNKQGVREWSVAR
jgi:hypothetical protein